jgi:nitroimidazol reductase NimA-like FMN-containing flavoprotein (pyridoxamine 5'-phosphate oxidase superfamily)
MLISEMTRQECCDLLARLGFGRLACAYENQPYIVPTYFAYEPEHLYGFAEWASVVVRGRYEELPEKPGYDSKMRQQAEVLLRKRFMWWQTGVAAAQTREQSNRGIPVFYCIHIEKVTGHRASRDRRPYRDRTSRATVPNVLTA